MAAERKDAAARERRLKTHGRRAAQRKASVAIIGAGRLGTALALALDARGYSIEAVVARRAAHARRAARLIASHPRPLTDAQLDLLPASDLLFITTPDDAIATTAARIATASMPASNSHQRTVLHTSGALSSDVLSDLRDAGFRTGSMHPLVSVSNSVSGAESLGSAFYCVEGEPAALRVARRIVSDLGGRSFSIRTRDKALYHASAVIASGHMVALFDVAAALLTRCGLSARQARAVLLPLVRSTLENLSKHDPAHALTGTFARADVATVKAHLEALCAEGSYDALAVYCLLGQRSLQLAESVGADAVALKQIALALKKAVKKS